MGVRACVCMRRSCWVGFEQAHPCSAPVAYEMRKAATVLQTSADKSTRVTPQVCICMCVYITCRFAYVAARKHVMCACVCGRSDHLCMRLWLRNARIEI